jgi:RNA polymerase sigma factor (sigma-70 family)
MTTQLVATPPPRRPPLTASQQDLAARYLPMARAIAKKLKYTWPSAFDEFESAAVLALVEAAQTFDAARNVKFSTFARYRIRGRLRDVQRDLVLSGWRGRGLPGPTLSTIRGDSEERGRVLLMAPEAAVGSEQESAEHVDAWLRKLPPDHAAVCRELFIGGCSQKDIAKRLNYSKSRISYLRKESLHMLKECYDAP